MPLRAVPFMLQGHREIAPLDGDGSAEARILWTHLQLALLILPRSPDPIRSWAERPLSMFIEIMRFFLEPQEAGWRGFGPGREV